MESNIHTDNELLLLLETFNDSSCTRMTDNERRGLNILKNVVFKAVICIENVIVLTQATKSKRDVSSSYKYIKYISSVQN